MADHREIIQCLGKQPHNTRQDAQKQAKRREFLQTYRCPYCHFFHVGKAPRSKPIRNNPK